MNPQAPAPSPADGQPVTPLARRVGPPLAVASVVATIALLVWMALAPTAVVGTLDEAPFTVPATLVLPPDDAGCFRILEGDATARTHCLERLAVQDDADPHGDLGHVETFFDERGRLLAGRYPDAFVVVDPATGEVVQDLGVDPDRDMQPVEPPMGSVHVHTDGDRVLRTDESGTMGEGEGEVLLDLHGPPGYQLHGAATSPDGAWVVAQTARGELVVAPTDGSAAPHVWAEVPDDRWMDLHRSIRWDQ